LKYAVVPAKKRSATLKKRKYLVIKKKTPRFLEVLSELFFPFLGIHSA
jgi:hypothetical protein